MQKYVPTAKVVYSECDKIREDISLGVLSFKAIAQKYNVSTFVVNLVWEVMCEQENEYECQ